MSLKIGAYVTPFIDIILLEEFYKISAKIRAASAQSLLECDFEYLSHVYNSLPEFQKEKWISTSPENPNWTSFYSFLVPPALDLHSECFEPLEERTSG